MIEPLSTITMQLNKHHRKDIGQLKKFKPGTSTRESPHTNFNRSTKTSTITINDVHRCRVFALLSSVFSLLLHEEALVIIPGMHPSDTCEQRKASHCRLQSKLMRREETCGTNPHAYLCKYSWWHDSLTDSQRPLAANAAGCLPLPSYSDSDSEHHDSPISIRGNQARDRRRTAHGLTGKLSHLLLRQHGGLGVEVVHALDHQCLLPKKKSLLLAKPNCGHEGAENGVGKVGR